MTQRRNHQRGSAMLVTLIIIASLLAGAVVLVSMQLASNRSSDLTRSATLSLYCAEAGLLAARSVIASTDMVTIEGALSSTSADSPEPDFLLTGIASHDIDGITTNDPDFHVYVVDNDDEAATGVTQNLSDDIDNRIWVISVCDRYPETPKSVSSLIQISQSAGTMYDWQAGGAFGNNNYNFQNTTR